MQEADYLPQGTVWKLPESLKRIESKAFANLPVTEIDIPEGVTEIAKDAFDGSSLIAIYTHGNQVAIDFPLSHGYIPLVP